MKKIGMVLAAVGMGLAVVTVAMAMMGKPEGGGLFGACCLPDGTCIGFVTSLDCESFFSGVYQGGGTNCGPFGCGACCLPDECLSPVSTDVCVNDLGGEYQGQATNCECQSPPACLGDVNFDGEIGIEEFLYVIGNWGPCP